MKKTFNVGSLFAGVGGFDLGLEQSENETKKFKIVFANEIDKYASATYSKNFNVPLIEGDINLLLDPASSKTNEEKEYYQSKRHILFDNEVDVLVGGFPCQSFSIAGERKGFEDERGNLFWSIVETIKQLGEHSKKPRVLFLENVKNLKSHDKGNTYQVIKSELEKLGYIVKEEVLNTMHFSNLPQTRERIYIMGFLNKEDSDKFTFYDELDKYRNDKSVEERLNDIESIFDKNITPENHNQYFYTKEKYPHYFKDKEEGINLEDSITEKNQFYQLRRGMYVRHNKSNACPTLTANMGTGGHNVPLILTDHGIRKLTPEEAFKLQGFPINNGYKLPTKFNGRVYPNGQLYKQAGNAVSVDIIKLIGERILEVL